MTFRARRAIEEADVIVGYTGYIKLIAHLVNPKSHHRTWQLTEAQGILLRYRKPATLVAIVSAAHRKQQNMEITTLDRMSECVIGMSSTVLVGNSSTYLQTGLMIMPRGYGGKRG
nr:MAG: precorrin-3B C17-methyltransferase [Candidatus Kentron sp. FW]